MMAEANSEVIPSFAAARAQEAWDNYGQPYLLSRLIPDLVKNGINYKEVLGEQRLKDFVQSAHNHVKVVVHPTQKAKIGLIPPGKEFKFTVDPSVSTKANFSPPLSEKFKGSRRRYIVSNFLQLLSELDDDDAAQVEIPTNILTKLMRDK